MIRGTHTLQQNKEHKTIDGKEYIVKSVFLGEKDVKTVILALAERKTMREMGIDIPIQTEPQNTS